MLFTGICKGTCSDSTTDPLIKKCLVGLLHCF